MISIPGSLKLTPTHVYN